MSVNARVSLWSTCRAWLLAKGELDLGLVRETSRTDAQQSRVAAA